MQSTTRDVVTNSNNVQSLLKPSRGRKRMTGHLSRSGPIDRWDEAEHATPTPFVPSDYDFLPAVEERFFE